MLLLGGTGVATVAGVLKFQDFVYFYTLGHLAANGDTQALSEYAELHRMQGVVVPEARDLIYPPVYPPYTALIFAPFAGLPYLTAAALWALLSAVAYALVVRAAWHAVSSQLPDGRLIAAAALAYPPFWQLIVNGQVTMIVLGAFTLGWLCLEHNRPLLAGAAFALLASKPQFGVPLAAIVLFRREWWMLAGALVGVAVQAGLVAYFLDASALIDFLRSVPQTLANADTLAAKPWASYSLRALTRVLPSWIGTPLWLLLAIVFVGLAVRTWRPDVPLRVRVGMMIVVSVLVSPHLLVYDATVLVLPLIWFAAWMEEPAQGAQRQGYRTLTHALLLAFALPIARAIGIQPAVVLLSWMCLLVYRTVWEKPAWRVQGDARRVQDDPPYTAGG